MKKKLEVPLIPQLEKICKSWVAEYKFHPTRRWRFDYANPLFMIAIEIEGGLWIRGRHNRPASMIADMEKYNQAAIMRWRVLRYTPQDILKSINDVDYIITNFYKLQTHQTMV